MLSASASSSNHWLSGLHPLEASQAFRTEEGAFVPRIAAHLRSDRTQPVGVQALWTASGSEIHSIGRDPALGRDPSEDAIRFRRFQLFPSARLLLRDGRPIEIGSRAFDLLTILLASRGSVVTKEEIFRHVWPSTVVEESNLRWQMVSLRKVLGEDGDLIKTIPGRGYLFACEAGEAGNTVREPNPLAPAPSASDLANPVVSFPDDPVPGNEPVVVVIDNDQNTRETIYGLLRSVGLRVECFATVREFTDTVPPSPPCCLILDVWLPGQNGLGLSSAVGQGERSDTGHLRQRPCRRSRGGSSDESGRLRVPYQTRTSRGAAERRERGDSVVDRSARPTRRKEDGGLTSSLAARRPKLTRCPETLCLARPPCDARELRGADSPLHELAPHFSASVRIDLTSDFQPTLSSKIMATCAFASRADSGSRVESSDPCCLNLGHEQSSLTFIPLSLPQNRRDRAIQIAYRVCRPTNNAGRYSTRSHTSKQDAPSLI